jgi:hypothetical protein
MCKSLSPAVAGLLVLLGAGRAPAQEAEARALVAKAVKAQGGADRFRRDLASHRKTKGVFHTDGFTFTGESFSEPGNRRRIVLRGTANGTPATRVLVLDGNKGWISYDGATYDLDDSFLKRLERSVYADRVCGLVTLLKDKGYTLSSLGEEPIKGKPALGVRVQFEGKPDVLLYFDKKSGLLVKSSSRVTDPNRNREVNQEVYYFDYRLLDPGADDERALRAAKLSTEGPALVEFLRKRIPTEAEQLKIRDLIVQLGHRSFGVRQRATAELKRLGLRAAPLLRQAARDKDEEVARRARQCLEQLAGDPDTALAAATVRLLALRRPPGAVEALLDYAAWAPEEAVAREVRGALATFAEDGGKGKRALRAALKDRDPQRRAAAVAALGQDGGAYLKQPWRRVLVSGVRVPMRSMLYRDGQHFMDLETVEAPQFFNRLDDSLFTTRP